MQGVTVTLSTTSGTSATLKGLSQTGSGHSTCKTTLPAKANSISGKVITVDESTSFKFDSSSKLSITCDRQMLSNGQSDLSADAQTLVFNTSAGAYQVPLAAIGSLSHSTVDQAAVSIQNQVLQNLKGAVLAFANTTCPSGWTNYTDGQGKFILGANSTHPFGENGGAETHQLTIAEMPSHSHGTKIAVNSGAPQAVYMPDRSGVTFSAANTDSTGADQPFSIMPPYKALTLCQKI